MGSVLPHRFMFLKKGRFLVFFFSMEWMRHMVFVPLQMLCMGEMGDMYGVCVFLVKNMRRMGLNMRRVRKVYLVLLLHEFVEIRETLVVCDRAMSIVRDAQEWNIFPFLVRNSENDRSCGFCKRKVGVTVVAHNDCIAPSFDAYHVAFECWGQVNYQLPMFKVHVEFWSAAAFLGHEDFH